MRALCRRSLEAKFASVFLCTSPASLPPSVLVLHALNRESKLETLHPLSPTAADAGARASGAPFGINIFPMATEEVSSEEVLSDSFSDTYLRKSVPFGANSFYRRMSKRPFEVSVLSLPVLLIFFHFFTWLPF